MARWSLDLGVSGGGEGLLGKGKGKGKGKGLLGKGIVSRLLLFNPLQLLGKGKGNPLQQ